MFSKLIHVVVYCRLSSIFKGELYSIVCIYHIFLTYSPTDGHLGCFLILGIVNNAAIYTNVQHLFLFLLSVILGIYPEVELLDHVVILLLIL